MSEASKFKEGDCVQYLGECWKIDTLSETRALLTDPTETQYTVAALVDLSPYRNEG